MSSAVITRMEPMKSCKDAALRFQIFMRPFIRIERKGDGIHALAADSSGAIGLYVYREAEADDPSILWMRDYEDRFGIRLHLECGVYWGETFEEFMGTVSEAIVRNETETLVPVTRENLRRFVWESKVDIREKRGFFRRPWITWPGAHVDPMVIFVYGVRKTDQLALGLAESLALGGSGVSLVHDGVHRIIHTELASPDIPDLYEAARNLNRFADALELANQIDPTPETMGLYRNLLMEAMGGEPDDLPPRIRL